MNRIDRNYLETLATANGFATLVLKAYTRKIIAVQASDVKNSKEQQRKSLLYIHVTFDYTIFKI
jgi:hypothetical protein